MAVGVLDQSLAQQASSLAYFDVFSFSAAVGVVLVLFILLMRRSVAEKGAQGGEESKGGEEIREAETLVGSSEFSHRAEAPDHG